MTVLINATNFGREEFSSFCQFPYAEGICSPCKSDLNEKVVGMPLSYVKSLFSSI